MVTLSDAFLKSWWRSLVSSTGLLASGKERDEQLAVILMLRKGEANRLMNNSLGAYVTMATMIFINEDKGLVSMISYDQKLFIFIGLDC